MSSEPICKVDSLKAKGLAGRKNVKRAESLPQNEQAMSAIMSGVDSMSFSKIAGLKRTPTERKRLALSDKQNAKSFLRFTPAILHHWLCNGDDSSEDIGKGIVKTLYVAMLLIDVSGFTKMSVKLGAELTQKHTCHFFDEIIHCIRHYGGDVLKFLGDALLVIWPATTPASPEIKTHLAVSAASAAAHVMKTLNGYEIEGHDILLTLHGGLAMGEIYAYDVGNIDRREFLVGGKVLGEIGDMEAEATSGQLVMSKAFADLLPEDAALERLETGHVRLDLDSLTGSDEGMKSMISEHLDLQFGLEPELADGKLDIFARSFKTHLESHVPRACRECTQEFMLDILGEMRQVTTLFLAMDFLVPYLNSGNVSLIQSCFCVITDSVGETGGAIRQFVLDDKGCVAICAWGLPHASHGHGRDAEKAIQCAFLILGGLKEALGKEGLKVGSLAGPHIGIAAGEVYVGLIGAALRCEYAMVGPSVNLAARLMGKAIPWQVLVEETVHNNALQHDEKWIFHDHDPVQAKGYDTKVKVFIPDSEHHSTMKQSFLDEFIEEWDDMSPPLQMVGKIASVLANGPDGHATDFPVRALLCVAEDLGISDVVQTRKQIIQLHARKILRRTRGESRGTACLAFAGQSMHDHVFSLLTTDYCCKVHAEYAAWIEHFLEHKEKGAETAEDLEAQKAKLDLLHHEFNARLEHHRQKGKGSDHRPRMIDWFHCCVARENHERVKGGYHKY